MRKPVGRIDNELARSNVASRTARKFRDSRALAFSDIRHRKSSSAENSKKNHRWAIPSRNDRACACSVALYALSREDDRKSSRLARACSAPDLSRTRSPPCYWPAARLYLIRERVMARSPNGNGEASAIFANTEETIARRFRFVLRSGGTLVSKIALRHFSPPIVRACARARACAHAGWRDPSLLAAAWHPPPVTQCPRAPLKNDGWINDVTGNKERTWLLSGIRQSAAAEGRAIRLNS